MARPAGVSSGLQILPPPHSPTTWRQRCQASASTASSTGRLADGATELAARTLLDVATALIRITARTAGRLAAAEAEIAHVVDGRDAFFAGNHALTADVAATAEGRYHAMAVDVVRRAATSIQAELDEYDALLVNRTRHLAALGEGLPEAPAAAAMVDTGLLTDIANGVASLGNAAVNNPEAVFGLLAGGALLYAGAQAVLGGVAVSASGVGIPVGVGGVGLGLGAMGAGLTAITASTAQLAAAAGGADRITPFGAAAVAATRPSSGPDPAAVPNGHPTRIPERESAENKIALQRENESAETLAKEGYEVEQSPSVPGAKNPDFRIEGEIFDNVAPTTDSARNIADRINEKVSDEQAKRIVLNLADSAVDLEAMGAQLRDWPIPGLEEVIVIDKQNRVVHLYP